MRILGIDPGVATIGFGLIESGSGVLRMLQYGTITTPAGQPLAARLLQISRDMEELIAAFQPEEMSIEELFFSKNITTGIAVAHARGVILCAAVTSVVCFCVGLTISFGFSTPVGATVVAADLTVFLAACLLAALRRK